MLTEEQKKERKKESNRKYRQSEKGKEAVKRYRESEKSRKASRKYRKSEKGKRNQMRYLLRKKKEKIKIKLLAFIFQLLNAGFKIKVNQVIDYSINGYLYKMRLVNE